MKNSLRVAPNFFFFFFFGALQDTHTHASVPIVFISRIPADQKASAKLLTVRKERRAVLI